MAHRDHVADEPRHGLGKEHGLIRIHTGDDVFQRCRGLFRGKPTLYNHKVDPAALLRKRNEEARLGGPFEGDVAGFCNELQRPVAKSASRDRRCL